MMYFIAVFVIGIQIVQLNCIHYCGSRMCGHTNEHTFCKYATGPGPRCLGYMHAPLTMEDKARIMARLNRRRSDVALGLNDWPPAGDMLKLRWVEELSREAQLWADQCSPPGNVEEHDVCRDLFSVTVGQCVASIVGEAPGLRPETMVDIWYMQRIAYDGNITYYRPSSSKSYSDFAQMIWSRSYMVGCGRSRFMTSWRGRVRSVERLVCNFAPRGPVSSRAVWTPGSPATLCPMRSQPDPDIPGLCTYQNVMDSQKNISVEEHLLNSVLELENNVSLNYMGSLDELYLRKIAFTTIGGIFTTESYNNYIYKREVAEIMGYDENMNKSEIIGMENINNITTTATTATIVPKTRKNTGKKLNIVGRPKSYNLDELEDETQEIANNVIADVTDVASGKKYLYEDIVYTDEENIDFSVTATLKSAMTETIVETANASLSLHQDMSSVSEENSSNNMKLEKVNTNLSLIFNAIKTFGNETLSNETDIEEYFSDPETFRQLQEALERMENNLAVPTTTASKVRRAIRPSDEKGVALKEQRYISPESLAELERNRTLQRGPMLSMVMKYLPYLKPYEKTILGKDTSNCVSKVMPSVILLLILCL